MDIITINAFKNYKGVCVHLNTNFDEKLDYRVLLKRLKVQYKFDKKNGDFTVIALKDKRFVFVGADNEVSFKKDGNNKKSIILYNTCVFYDKGNKDDDWKQPYMQNNVNELKRMIDYLKELKEDE